MKIIILRIKSESSESYLIIIFGINNANVLAMGGRVIGVEVAKDIVDTFLNTKFEGGRHEGRVNKIMSLE